MKVEEFIAKLTEIMDTETELTMDTKLKDVEEWDSLSVVSFLSYCNVKLKCALEPNTVKAAETVGDLFKLIGDK